MRLALLLLSLSPISRAQHPSRAAADGPGEKASLHDDPPTPATVYVYLTRGGVMRFHRVTGEHVAGFIIDRRPVEAGSIRFAHGASETHRVEYPGEEPARDLRLPPVSIDPSHSAIERQFENRQVRMLGAMCAAREGCPAAALPWIDIVMSGSVRRRVQWSPRAADGTLELVRIELKTQPEKA